MSSLDAPSTTVDAMRSLTILLVLGLLTTASLRAQEADVRRDPATGDYLVTIFDDDLEPREIRIVPADRVDIDLDVGAELLPGSMVRYRYDVETRTMSRLPLRTLEIDCPRDAAVATVEARVAWTGGPRSLNTTRDGASCVVMLGSAPLPADGGPLEWAIESDHLPEIGDARAIGATGAVRWPTTDPIPENAPARRFIETVNGIDGGWRTFTVVVPGRPPESMDDPAEGLVLVSGDLDRVCDDLGWITNRGICRSLQAKLDAASRAVTRGRAGAARGSLNAFLNELDAQRGKHVDVRAHALLSVGAAFLLEGLAGG